MGTIFPHLEDLIKTYFHQDYDLIAEDLEGLMHHYVSTTPQANRDAVRADIERYLSAHAKGLDATFRREYAYDVDPETWGYSTEAFLRKLASLIA